MNGRFKIDVIELRKAIVTDTQTNKVYKCKVEPYHRTDKDGNRVARRQVKVLGIPKISQSSGVVQVPTTIDKATGKQKLKVTFYSNLDGKKSTGGDFNAEFI